MGQFVKQWPDRSNVGKLHWKHWSKLLQVIQLMSLQSAHTPVVVTGWEDGQVEMQFPL